MFDPIHFGHLRPALEILESLRLDHLRFMPCAQPPHRPEPVTDAELRCRLVAAAIEGQPGFVLDRRELDRAGPSYTVDTLRSLREEFPERPLCLLLGMDAFVSLPRWHRWKDIPGLAHLVVMHRPGSALTLDAELAAVFNARRVHEPDQLAAAPAGNVYLQSVSQLEISSTFVRERIARGGSARYLMPEAARQLIEELGLYTRA